MRISLREKYSFIFLCVVATIVAILAYGSLTAYRKSIEAMRTSAVEDSSKALMGQMYERAESLASLLSEELINPFYHYDLATIGSILRDTVKQADILSVVVFDTDCKIVHDGSVDIMRFGQRLDYKSNCREKEENHLAKTLEDDSLIVSKQIFFGEIALGGISVELSLNDIHQSIQELESHFKQSEEEWLQTIYRQVSIITALLLFLVLATARFIAVKLVNPIEIISKHARMIGKGQYDQPLHLDRNDEIGDLVRSFEQMRLDLKSSTVSIERLQEEIFEKVEAENQRKKMEQQLRQAQRMEGVGQLAAGVAHDLNNILSGIVTLPQLLLMDLPDDSPLKKPLQTIQRSGNRAAIIVRDMLTLARSGMNVEEVIDPVAMLKSYINSPESMKLEQTHPGIDIKISWAENIMNIKGSPVHLTKTLMNLVNNAVDAIEGTGEVTIALNIVYVDKPFGTYDSISEGDYVRLSVRDSGTGISPEDLPHVFEPFYTKKVMGRSGTGLGMAIVWNTVKDHHGYIDIQSEVGGGTKVDLYFPITTELLQETTDEPDFLTFQGQQEKILVIDDVAIQRQIATTILKKLNYKVESVAGGLEAVDYLTKQSVDLIILDMIMEPGIDGLETCRRIFSICPISRILIASGYSKNEMVREALALGAIKYIQKPYSIETLGSAVRNILDES